MDTPLVVTLLLLASGCALFATAADFQDCGDQPIGVYKSITVFNCTSDDDKCPLYRGSNATIAITFETKEVVSKVRQSVHGVIASVPVPFPTEEDACQNTGLSCPLGAGTHNYQYSIFVKKVYPKLSVEVKWELLNENGKQIVCVIIPAILK